MLNSIIEYIINNRINIKFYNLSYREYVCLYKEYIIFIYPFVYKIDNYNRDELYRYHHIDFKENKIKYDPCDIYEIVSGYKIHTDKNVIDNQYLSNECFIEESKLFLSKLSNFKRLLKIKRLKNV